MAIPKIDWNEVAKIVQNGASGVNAAAVLGISVESLYDHFERDFPGQKWGVWKSTQQAKGFQKLRDSMMTNAIDNMSTPMQIFLAKNLLGMSDKIEQKIEVKDWKVNFDIDDPGYDNENLKDMD